MNFFIKDFLSKCDHIRRKLRIRSHLLKKPYEKLYLLCSVPTKNPDFIVYVSKLVNKEVSNSKVLFGNIFQRLKKDTYETTRVKPSMMFLKKKEIYGRCSSK